MKFSVQTAVLPELTPRQVVEKLSAHGYDAVEWRVHPDYHIPPGELVARAGEIRSLVEDQGLSPIGIKEPGMIGIKEPVTGGRRASRRG